MKMKENTDYLQCAFYFINMYISYSLPFFVSLQIFALDHESLLKQRHIFADLALLGEGTPRDACVYILVQSILMLVSISLLFFNPLETKTNLAVPWKRTISNIIFYFSFYYLRFVGLLIAVVSSIALLAIEDVRDSFISTWIVFFLLIQVASAAYYFSVFVGVGSYRA